MVFPEDNLMARLFIPDIAEFYEKTYTDKGVTIEKNALVSALEGEGGKVTAAVLKDGRKLPADIIVVGTGARPNAELFKDQLEMAAGGVSVNSKLQTNHPDVYAIGLTLFSSDIVASEQSTGDVAAFPLLMYGGVVNRQEHVTNCRLSAFHAVDAIMKPDTTGDYDYLPFFYSRVFNLSWKFYGINKGSPINFGDKAEGVFGCYWVDEGKVVGAFLESGSDDQNNAIKAVAKLRPDAPDDLATQGISFALDVAAANAKV